MSFKIAKTASRQASSPATELEESSAQNSRPKNQELKPPLSPLRIQPKLTVGAPDDLYEKEADAVADRVMRMPEQTYIQRECEHRKEEERVQKKSLISSISPFLRGKSKSKVPTTTDSLTRSIQSSRGAGTSLDRDTHSFMSSRFDNDFSHVTIHTDRKAGQMSQELNAKAFTLGEDIYFNQGQYQPHSSEGKRLLAHELTHVVQQRGSFLTQAVQRACHDEGNETLTMTSCPEGSTDVARQAPGQPNALDPRADAIIATASRTDSNPSKALKVVHDMICAYMPGQASKVRKINYFSGEQGLKVRSVGSGSTAQGDLCVGDTFLNTTSRKGISRRLLQLAHELEHIEQYRTGLAGGNHKAEREFLAFYHEGMAEEFIGTGRMADNTRKSLIDAALGQYNCFSAQLQTTHLSKKNDLLTRRQTVNGTRGNASTSPPSGCIAQ